MTLVYQRGWHGIHQHAIPEGAAGVCTCAWEWRGQRSMLCIFFSHPQPFSMSQSFLLNLQVTVLGELTGQQKTGITCLHPCITGLWARSTALGFVHGSELGLCWCREQFTQWALFIPGPTIHAVCLWDSREHAPGQLDNNTLSSATLWNYLFNNLIINERQTQNKAPVKNLRDKIQCSVKKKK